MTAQLPNIINFKGNRYDLRGYEDSLLKVDPNDYGIKSARRSSNCWAGYISEYDLREDGLYLSYLHISHGKYVEEYDDETKEIIQQYKRSLPEDMPTIMGIEAERGKGYRFNIRYNLNLNTHYNGRLSFSREYEAKFRIKNGKQKTYRIKEVIGAEFLDGKIISITDFTEDEWYAQQAIDARKKVEKDSVARMMYKSWYHTFDTNYEDRVQYLKAWAEKGRIYVAEHSIEVPEYICDVISNSK